MPTGSAALLVMLGLPPLLEEARASPLMHEQPPFAAAQHDDDDGEPDAGIPIVASFAEAVAGLPETIVPPRRTWVRHRVRPRERITQIAARYGVTEHELVADNRLDPNLPRPKGYRGLRVLARRIPPPRAKVRYVAQADQSWGDVAAILRVEELDLRAWNWQKRKLWSGRELVAWVDPTAGATWRPGDGPPVPEAFDVPTGGVSVGRPQRGTLQDGVLLPDSELYERRASTHGLWGSSHTVLQIQRAFAAFRHDTGYAHEVVIGAISRRSGGRFHPHASHQSGRDIDIRLPRLPGVPDTDDPNPDEIDWYATWGIIKAFIDTDEVSLVFLEVDLHRRLYEAARTMGETPDTLAQWIQWPTWHRRARPIIRHEDGHDGHIHVRLDCGPEEPRCRRG